MRITVNNQLKEMKCRKCDGKGLEGNAESCKECQNIGFVKERHQETIDVPKGVSKSTPIKIPNEAILNLNNEPCHRVIVKS